MKMKKAFYLFLAAFATVFSSCDDDDNESTSASGKILFSTTVTNPAGDSGSGYLQTISELGGGANYDNYNAISLGFGSYPCVCESGNIYVFPDYMGGSKLELKKYVLNSSNQLELKGTMPLPANSSAAIVVEANSKKAYVCCQSLDLIIVFNPETMTEISRIDVSSLRNDGVSAYPGALCIRDNILYVTLEQYNSQWMPVENSIELALYNVSDDSFIKRIRNTSLGYCGPSRPIDNQSIFVDENGDMYINCVGSFGYIPGLDAGIARIKKGETEIDENYKFNLSSATVDGLPCSLNMIGKCQYTSDGIMYGYGYAIGLDPENTNTYTARTGVPVVVDLNKKTVKVIKGLPLTNGHGMAMGIHKGKIVYGSANDSYNGFCTYDPVTGDIETKAITVTGFPSFFYSFEK